MSPSTRIVKSAPEHSPPLDAACSLLPMIPDQQLISEALYERLDEGGCPLAPPIRDRIRFEALLADLSATFVNVPADRVDAQIMAGLQQIVEFLGIDRSGFAQLMPGENNIAITHSFQIEGVPPTPQVILEAQFPVYARKIREGVPFRLPDDIENIVEATAEREYLMHSGLKSQLTIPLKMNGAVVGGIGFASFSQHIRWPDELVRRLRLIGDIFTNALSRKQVDSDLRALGSRLLTAQEEERRLVAREMHDDWTQRLAVLGLDVAILEKFFGDPTAASPLLRTIQNRLLTLSEDVHDLSRQLHPNILHDLGLVEALRSECAAFTRREQITIDFRADALPQNVSSDVALCVYRIAQEALRNVAKHAAVSRCSVTLLLMDKNLELTVRDEGIGFQPSRVRREVSLGLASMEERARLVRASFTVTSMPDQGTTVVVHAPFEDASP